MEIETGIGPIVAKYKPGEAHPEHTHRNTLLRIVMQGGFLEGELDRPCATHMPGHVLFAPRDFSHAHVASPVGALVFGIRLSRKFLDGLPSTYEWQQAIERPNFVSRAAALNLWQLFSMRDASAQMDTEGWVTNLLVGLANVPRPTLDARPPSWLRKVHCRLHEQFAEPLSLTELSQSAAVDRAHLAKSFRRFYGVSIGEFVRRLRLELCCRQLAFTDVPINHIAVTAGFFDHSHFHREFRRRFGQTPLAYREQVVRQ